MCKTFFCSGTNGGSNGHEGTITNMHGYFAAFGNPNNPNYSSEIMMDVGSNLGFILYWTPNLATKHLHLTHQHLVCTRHREWLK